MVRLSDLFRINNSKNAIVLMYHRIAKPFSDVWDIAVSPDNFEQHLKYLKRAGNVVSLQTLGNLIYTGKPLKNQIALTFDDGYADNFEIAAPMLQKYNLPATFFITGAEGVNMHEYWWDSLERIILFTELLPQRFSMWLSGDQIEHDIGDEVSLTNETGKKHIAWHACNQSPPTNRALLYYHLWSKMKLLPFDEQYLFLNEIKKWAGVNIDESAGNKTMPVADLKNLSKNDLFTIGAHTATHAALGFHEVGFQKAEMVKNIDFLQRALDCQISLISYPYGSYSGDTLMLAHELGLLGGFTTEEVGIQAGISPFKTGRFQVKNMDGAAFKKIIQTWTS
jgi:peptidoglycan/xylan/chitin deacetylase (PgdA/CDA1 family)